MKTFIKILTLLLFTGINNAQETVMDFQSRSEIYIATSGLAAGDLVRYKMEALGTAWEKTSYGQALTTSNPFFLTSYYPGRAYIYPGNNYTDTMVFNSSWNSPMSFPPDGWAGYNWQLDENNTIYCVQDDFCWGLYRFSVWLFDHDEDTYTERNHFIIDYRNFDYPGIGGVDLWISYRADQNYFSYANRVILPITPDDSQWFPLSIGQYIGIWEIKSPTGSLPVTAPFSSFWSNCLVVTVNQNNNPRLIWGRHPDFNTTSYKVYRAVSSTPAAHPLTLNYSLIHTTTATNIFEYTDIDLRLGSWDYIYYYVKAYYSGTGTFSPISNIAQTRAGFYKENSEYSEGANSSNTFYLRANYPNPFNPGTVISYQIASNSFVILKVYDVLGNEVAVLVNEWQETGSYTAQFSTSGKQLQSGVYFYQLRAGNFAETKKCILLK